MSRADFEKQGTSSDLSETKDHVLVKHKGAVREVEKRIPDQHLFISARKTEE